MFHIQFVHSHARYNLYQVIENRNLTYQPGNSITCVQTIVRWFVVNQCRTGCIFDVGVRTIYVSYHKLIHSKHCVSCSYVGNSARGQLAYYDGSVLVDNQSVNTVNTFCCNAIYQNWCSSLERNLSTLQYVKVLLEVGDSHDTVFGSIFYHSIACYIDTYSIYLSGVCKDFEYITICESRIYSRFPWLQHNERIILVEYRSRRHVNIEIIIRFIKFD